jgi:hypothetical protein
VISCIFDSPWKSSGEGFAKAVLGGWTLAPSFEASSGRPYNLLTFNDSTLINNGATARPNVVPLGTSASFASPDKKVELAQPPLGLIGNLGRNVYRTDSFVSGNFRLTRHFSIGEFRSFDLSMDVFNVFNRVNISKVDNSFTQGGRPVAAFDPRQIQFSAKLVF